MGTAGVLGDIATNSRGTLARRVRRKIQTVRFYPFVQREVDDTWFDDCTAPICLNIEYTVHVRELDDDPTSVGHGTTGEARTCASCN